MKRLFYDRLLSAVAVLLWMGVIFVFSAQTGAISGGTSGRILKVFIGIFYPNFDSLSPDLQSSIMSVWHTVIRKVAHFSEYAVLAALSANAIRTYNLSRALKFAIPVGVGFLYAVSDEIHQLFVADRAGSPKDVLIDTSGALFGTLVFFLIYFICVKVKKKKGIKGEII